MDEVYREVESILRRVRRGGADRLGYVAGIINSDGPEHAERNFRNLEFYTKILQGRTSFPIFSATEIFHAELLQRLRAREHIGDEFIKFWRSVLSSGHVTDVFFTPRWDESAGALDEHEIAKITGLSVHYLGPINFDQHAEI